MLSALSISGLVEAQTGCTHASLTQTKAWPPTPNKIAIDISNSDTSLLGLRPKNIRGAVSDWNDNTACANSLPEITAWDSSMNPLRGDVERWVVKVGTYESFDQDEDTTLHGAAKRRNACAGVLHGTKRIYIYTNAEPPSGRTCRSYRERLAHELGHLLRLDDTTNAICQHSVMYTGSLPSNKKITAEVCRDAKRELDREVDCEEDKYEDHPDCQDDGCDDGEEESSNSIFEVDENGMLVFVGDRSSTSSTCPAPTPVDPCDENPDLPSCGDVCDTNQDLPQCQPDCDMNPTAEGCPVDCSRQPSHPDCDCSVNPDVPCPVVETCDGLWNDHNGNGRIDQGECTPNQYSPIPNGGGRRTGRVSSSATGSSGAGYALALAKRSSVALTLTGMTRDFDCRVVPAGGTDRPGTPPPDAAEDGTAPPDPAPSPSLCTTNAGTQGDSWSGALDAGTHTVQVWPFGSGAGNFTLTVSFTELEDGAKPAVPTPAANPVRTLPFEDSRTVAAGAGEQSYTFKIPSTGTVGVALTKLSTDFDCYVTVGATKRRCTNHSSTTDDSWSQSLDAGVYSVQIYAWRKDAGSYTVSVTGPSQATPPAPVPPADPDPPAPDPDPDPEPDPTTRDHVQRRNEGRQGDAADREQEYDLQHHVQGDGQCRGDGLRLLCRDGRAAVKAGAAIPCRSAR